MLAVPFRISFEDDNSIWNYFDAIDNFSDFIFLFDILLSFNTGFYDRGIHFQINHYR